MLIHIQIYHTHLLSICLSDTVITDYYGHLFLVPVSNSELHDVLPSQVLVANRRIMG